MAHPPCIRVLVGWDQEVIYFVTFNVAGRQRTLANVPAYTTWKSAVSRLTDLTVIAGVMIPDHLRMLAFPHQRDASVGDFSGAIKRWMLQQARRDDWCWQKDPFDRLLRHNETKQDQLLR